jgi:hypothetical protein
VTCLARLIVVPLFWELWSVYLDDQEEFVICLGKPFWDFS